MKAFFLFVAAEIAFQRMHEDIGDAADELFFRHRVGELRIMKARTGRLSGLLRPTLRMVSSLVSTAESLVSLPAAASVSTEPNIMVFSSFGAAAPQSQDIRAGIGCAVGNGLGRVDDTAAADGEDEVGLE